MYLIPWACWMGSGCISEFGIELTWTSSNFPWAEKNEKTLVGPQALFTRFGLLLQSVAAIHLWRG